MFREDEGRLRTWPLRLAHRGVAVGRGFRARVDVDGRLVAHEDSTGVWLEGVTPAGLVIDAGAATMADLQPRVRETLAETLDSFAGDAGTFGEFRDAVQAFLGATDAEAGRAWRDAVERVRSTRERPDGLGVWPADRETSVTVTPFPARQAAGRRGSRHGRVPVGTPREA